MSWTPEKEEKLKKLWKQGHTASQIASMLGDTTRNAVIGKAHRLNLEARAPSKNSGTPSSRDNRQVKRSPAPTSRKAKFQSILLDKNFEPENPKSLENLTDETCKWPIGHPNEEKFYLYIMHYVMLGVLWYVICLLLFVNPNLIHCNLNLCCFTMS